MATPPPEIVAAACEAQRKWKIPASISLAQWALESGWGRHMPPGSNNPFGMKARPGDPFVTVRTREQDRDGHDYFIEAAFRKFGSIAEAFDAHGALLNKPAYARARAALPDPDRFADALTGVYASDKRYGKALRAVMHGSNFYQYDGAAG